MNVKLIIIHSILKVVGWTLVFRSHYSWEIPLNTKMVPKEKR